jgi:hypothetical protein
MRVQLDIDEDDWKTLRRRWTMIQNFFEEDDSSYSFRDFLEETIHDECEYIRNGVRPENDPEITNNILHVVNKHKGVTPRQVLDVITDPVWGN